MRAVALNPGRKRAPSYNKHTESSKKIFICLLHRHPPLRMLLTFRLDNPHKTTAIAPRQKAKRRHRNNIGMFQKRLFYSIVLCHEPGIIIGLEPTVQLKNRQQNQMLFIKTQILVLNIVQLPINNIRNNHKQNGKSKLRHNQNLPQARTLQMRDTLQHIRRSKSRQIKCGIHPRHQTHEHGKREKTRQEHEQHRHVQSVMRICACADF